MSQTDYGETISFSSDAEDPRSLGPFERDTTLVVTGYAQSSSDSRPPSNIRIAYSVVRDGDDGGQGQATVVLGFDDFGNDGDFDDLYLGIDFLDRRPERAPHAPEQWVAAFSFSDDATKAQVVVPRNYRVWFAGASFSSRAYAQMRNTATNETFSIGEFASTPPARLSDVTYEVTGFSIDADQSRPASRMRIRGGNDKEDVVVLGFDDHRKLGTFGDFIANFFFRNVDV